MDIVNRFWDYSSFIPSSMSFLLTVGFLKVGNQPTEGNRKRHATKERMNSCNLLFHHGFILSTMSCS